MKLKSILLVIGISLALTAASHAATVYVAESAADVTNAQLHAGGFNGQDGTALNPFGSIQAAYSYLWNTAGDHTIYLVNDGDGVWSGTELGVNEYDNGDGYIRMAAAGLNQWPTTDPSWTSVTLDGQGGATLSLTDPQTGFQSGGYPAAFEKEVTNPGGNNTANRGSVIRGLWNASSSQSLLGMEVQNLDIYLGGGHVLVGSTSAGAGTVNEFTFTNVNLTLENDVTDDLGITGDPWGQAALFVVHADEATSLTPSYLDFNNSNIYLRNDDGSAWSDVFYVGHSWAGYLFPDNFVDGNSTSGFSYWDGSQYVEYDSSFNIYQSSRNPNNLTAYLLGSTGNDFFALSTFNVSGGGGDPIPEPASMVLMMLAGSAMMLRRRRA